MRWDVRGDVAGAPAFHDHFSAYARAYARARPTYPRALLARLAALSPARTRAWDAGTGSGQAAVALAAHFDAVVATDPSAAQLASATRHRRVTYAVATAEASALADASCDLVTVAQALHWFDVPRFWDEVRRVLRPGGIVAAWTYARLRTAPAVEAIVDALEDRVRPWWPPERAHVDSGYATLPFPFAAVPFDAPAMQVRWTRDELLDYLRTWSAVRRHAAAHAPHHGHDAVDAIAAPLAAAWGRAERRTVRFPLSIRVGRAKG